MFSPFFQGSLFCDLFRKHLPPKVFRLFEISGLRQEKSQSRHRRPKVQYIVFAERNGNHNYTLRKLF